ncbi:hypothetical protein ACQ9ZH_21040 [Pseudomonas chlororaphis]
MAIKQRKNEGVEINSQLHRIDITVSNSRKVLVISYRSNSSSLYTECKKTSDNSKRLDVEEHFPILDENVLSSIEEVFNSIKYYGHDFNLGNVEEILMKWLISNIFIDTSLLGEYEIYVFKNRALDNIDELKQGLFSARKDKSLYAGSPEENVHIPLGKASFYQLKEEYESRPEFKIKENVKVSSSNDFDFDDDILSKDFNKEETSQNAKHLNDDFNFDELDDEPKTKNSDLTCDEVLADFEEILETGTERVATEEPDSIDELFSNNFDFSNDKEKNIQVSTLRENIKGSALENARGIKKKKD